jgi:hypothetical protein
MAIKPLLRLANSKGYRDGNDSTSDEGIRLGIPVILLEGHMLREAQKSLLLSREIT